MGLDIDIKDAFNGFLTNYSKILFVVPKKNKFILKSIIVNNIDEDLPHEVTLSLVSHNSYIQLIPRSVYPCRMFYFDQSVTMEADAYIKGHADTGNKVSVKLSGVMEKL